MPSTRDPAALTPPEPTEAERFIRTLKEQWDGQTSDVLELYGPGSTTTIVTDAGIGIDRSALRGEFVNNLPNSHLASYLQVESAGFDSGALHHNLGNTYFRSTSYVGGD